jgi:hypothetical protein
MCPFLHPPIPLISRVLNKFKTECREGLLVIPNLVRPEIRQSVRTINSTETNFGGKRTSPDRRILNEEMYRCIFRKETNIPSRGTSNVSTEKQFSSFYSKPSSLLAPYILLQPEINIGKTIWHISRFYKNLIKEPSKFSLCAIAFCKELIIRVRPDLETFIFMVIENAHILYYKYFFLYVLQCEQQELCWQITLQPSFFWDSTLFYVQL